MNDIRDIPVASVPDEALGRYELIVESMTEGVSLSTEDGTIVYTNSAEDRLFGYGPGELIGQHVSVQNAYAPDDNRRRVDDVIEHLKTVGAWEGDWLNRRKDGSVFVTASRITSVDLGGRTHWLCVQRDVTLERENERRFRQLADLAPSFVWFASADGQLHFLNGRWYEYTGQTEEEALPNGWANTLHPDDVQRTLAVWQDALERGGKYEVECRYRNRSGEYRWYVARAEPLRDAQGAITSWFGTSTDIHDQKLAEEKLRNIATRLELAASAHHIGIFDWHIPSGRLIWTEEEERLFGLPAGQFGGMIDDWAACVHSDDLQPMNDVMQAAMNQRLDSLNFEFRIRRPDGEVRWIEGSSRFLYAEDGKPERMVGTNIDVTERRRAEEHQRLLVNELNHRVKNTLAIVQSIAQQSFRGASASPEAQRAFEDRLAALSSAHNILTEEHWESASIRAITEEAIGAHAGNSGRVSFDGPDVQVPPKTAVSLALALHELATNAAKYGALSRAEGRVSIAWSVAEGRLLLTWREQDGPAVEPPARRGFGTRMIERVLASELGGRVTLDFEPEGCVCTVDAPLPVNA